MPRPRDINKRQEPERRQTGVKLDWELWLTFRERALHERTSAGLLLEKLMREHLEERAKKGA